MIEVLSELEVSVHDDHDWTMGITLCEPLHDLILGRMAGGATATATVMGDVSGHEQFALDEGNEMMQSSEVSDEIKQHLGKNNHRVKPSSRPTGSS
jgi:hypothetical protein